VHDALNGELMMMMMVESHEEGGAQVDGFWLEKEVRRGGRGIM
jgi:hypothetical protein